MADYCRNHPEIEAKGRCTGCAELFCNDCLVEIGGRQYCGSCKIMAVRTDSIAEGATRPCEEADSALKYAIFGIFCFGIILGPIAISKAMKARQMIREDPRLSGYGKTTGAIIVSIVAMVSWVLGMFMRFSK